jgi:hypothetical protein
VQPIKNPHHRGARQDKRDQEAGPCCDNPRIHGSPPSEVRLDFSLRAMPLLFEGTSNRVCASDHLDSLRNSSSPPTYVSRIAKRGPVRNVPKANLFRSCRKMLGAAGASNVDDLTAYGEWPASASLMGGADHSG